MAINKISDIVGLATVELSISKTNNAFFQHIFARREPLSLNVLYNQIDPQDPDDVDYSKFTPLSELGYVYTPRPPKSVKSNITHNVYLRNENASDNNIINPPHNTAPSIPGVPPSIPSSSTFVAPDSDIVYGNSFKDDKSPTFTIKK